MKNVYTISEGLFMDKKIVSTDGWWGVKDYYDSDKVNEVTSLIWDGGREGQRTDISQMGLRCVGLGYYQHQYYYVYHYYCFCFGIVKLAIVDLLAIVVVVIVINRVVVGVGVVCHYQMEKTNNFFFRSTYY